MEAVTDNNLNLASYLRANYSTATTLPWTTGPQNDDNITITINAGKTVTIGSSRLPAGRKQIQPPIQ